MFKLPPFIRRMDWRVLVLVAAITVLRIKFCYDVDTGIQGDAVDYTDLATWFMKSGIFGSDLATNRPPLYPVLLGSFAGLFNGHPQDRLVYGALNCVLDFISALLLVRIGARIGGRATLAGVLLVGLTPVWFGHVNCPVSEDLSVVVFLAFLERWTVEARSMRDELLAGLYLAFLSLTRSYFILFPLAILGWEWWLPRMPKGYKLEASRMPRFLVACYGPTVLWGFRNLAIFGKFVMTQSNSPPIMMAWTAIKVPTFDYRIESDKALWENHPWKDVLLGNGYAKPERLAEVYHLMSKEIIDYLVHHPFEYLFNLVPKTMRLWVTGWWNPFSYVFSPYYFRSMYIGSFCLPVLILGIVGLVSQWRQPKGIAAGLAISRWRATRIQALLALYITLITLPLMVDARYSLPAFVAFSLWVSSGFAAIFLPRPAGSAASFTKTVSRSPTVVTRSTTRNARELRASKVAREKWFARVLAGLSIATLLILAAIRVYALYNTVPVRTWDDRFYRWQAQESMNVTSLFDAVKGVVLPNANNLLGERTIGYHSWLVLFGKAFVGVDFERVWQYANLVLFALQLFLVYLLARWATREKLFPIGVVALYALSPVVFGMTRWAFTENHSMTALLVFSTIGCLMLAPTHPAGESKHLPRPGEKLSREFILKSLLLPALAGWAFGISSTLREYMLPNFVALAVALVMGLILDGKKVAASVFLVVLTPFIEAMCRALPQVFKVIAWKSGLERYFHPLTEWTPHVLVHTIGLPIFLVLVAGIILSLAELRKFMQRTQSKRKAGAIRTLWERRGEVQGIHLFYIAHFLLVLFYLGFILHSQNRVVRPAIPPMLTAICLLLMSTRLFRWNERAFWKSAVATLIPLILFSWIFMAHALFFAFDGGKSFALDPYPLEHYNYPLELRPLRDAWDMHVSRDS